MFIFKKEALFKDGRQQDTGIVYVKCITKDCVVILLQCNMALL